MSSQKRPGGPAGAGPSKRQNMAEDEDEDMGFDEEEMLAMEEEMADEAGQEDGPAPPDEEVAACLTKTQFAACAKQWTRPKVPPLDPAKDEVTFQQSEVCHRRCPPTPTFTTTALATSTVATASVATTNPSVSLTTALNRHHPNRHQAHRHGPPRLQPVPSPLAHHASPPRRASRRWTTRSTA